MKILLLNIFTFICISYCVGQSGLCNNDTLYISDNAIVCVEGDFENQHVAFENDGEFSLLGDFESKSKILAPGKGSFRLVGKKAQDLNLMADLEISNIEIINTDGVYLNGNSNLIVLQDLDFVDGVFYTKQNSLIVFKENSLYFDLKNSSYIDGPTVKVGKTEFTFPIGSNGRLSPVRIGNTPESNSYQIEYFNKTFSSLEVDETLVMVSDWEFWNVNQLTGIDKPKLTFSSNESSFIRPKPDDLQLAHFGSDNKWRRVESSNQLPEQLEGEISTTNEIPDFGFFTFGSTNPDFIIQDGVLDISVNKAGCNVLVEWTGIERAGRVSSYSIQRKLGRDAYREIANVAANNNTATDTYAYQDTGLEDQYVYLYRVRANYSDGSASHSDWKAMKASCSPITLSIYPNPIVQNDQLFVSVNSDIDTTLELLVVDVLGQILDKKKISVTKGVSRHVVTDTQHYGSTEAFLWVPELDYIPTQKFQVIN